MKKFLILFLVVTAVLGSDNEAKAGLNLYVNLGGPSRYYRSSAYCDYGYGRPVSRYYSRSSYYGPRYRRYYFAPVYYRSGPRYSHRRHRY